MSSIPEAAISRDLHAFFAAGRIGDWDRNWLVVF